MRDLGAASKLIATTQTAVAKSQSVAVDLADELYGGAPPVNPTPALSKQQAAVRASRENQRLRKQNAKRMEMLATHGIWIAPQPLIQRRQRAPQQPQYMQQLVPQAVMLPPGVYLVNSNGQPQPQAQHSAVPPGQPNSMA